jgi:amino acid adenylation domain-containing protein
MIQSPKRRFSLDAKRLAVLDALLERESPGSGTAQGIPRVAERDALPLSFAQQRLWFLDQLTPGSPAYNLPSALRIGGPLDAAVLARVLTTIAARHETLRTVFRVTGNEPVQEILPAGPVALPVIDLTAAGPAERESEARRLIADEAWRPFDLRQGPLLRCALLRLAAGDHVLLLTLHHIVSDGWSMGLLVRETAALYQAALKGTPPRLPDVSIQYGDFAHWQRSWLAGERLEKELSYWRERLAGAPVTLELPTDRPHPAVQSFRGSSCGVELPAVLHEGLERLAREERGTLFTVLLAVFQVLLHRYSGQDDISVGTPIAGRSRIETEPLIGFFVNTLVHRTDLSGDPGFRDLLRRAHRGVVEDQEHQDLPFEKLVQELSPSRSLSQHPLFQAMLSFNNLPQEEVGLEGLSLRPLNAEAATAKLDVTLTLGPGRQGQGLVGSLGYAVDLFDPPTPERMAGHLRVLIEGVVEDPARRLSELPLLGAAERQQLVAEWNDTAGPGPRRSCLHELFELYAERAPEAAAVACEGQSVTYAELNRRANQLARHLMRRGVGPGVPVALFVERSLDMMVGLLGILKAGGAYVPLDPAHPRERLEAILGEVEPPVAVTQDRLLGQLPDGAWTAVRLDGDAAALAREPEENPAGGAGGGDLVYILFTSGSTGRPKGVAVEHRQLTHYLDAVLARMDLPEGSLYATVSTLAVDLGHTVLFAPLVTGGTAHIILLERAADPDALADYFGRHPVDCAKFVPSHLAALAVSPRFASILPRRLLVLGGEAASRDLLARIDALAPALGSDYRVLNHYGPTETTVGVLTWPARRGMTALPLGRPLADTEIRVLDARLWPVPIGVPGELVIGGAGLSRGYLGRPEQTAERFIPDPWSGRAGARLYRTGDLSRLRPDGVVEFLGRVDHQVKIRGFRIEPAEIEAVLGRHPAVRESIVMARREDGVAEARLVAYVVLREGAGADLGPRELRDFVRERLPDAMVPAAFVLLPALPLARGGKVDRRALAGIEPVLDRAAAGEEGAERARTPAEEVLAGLFAEVLRIDRVGLHDGFFDLGGHSLLATQLIARVRQALGCEIALRALFERPTVAGLAAAVAEAQGGRTLPPLIPMAPVADTGGERPLSFAQRRLWLIAELEPQSAAYNIPAALALSGALDAAALAGSLTEIVRRHEVLRTRFEGAGTGTEPMSRVSPAEPLRLPLVDLSALPEDAREEELDRRIREEAGRPFDLAQAPLLRAALLRRGPGEHALLVTVHHIASDGWSRGILVRELAALYTALAAGQPSPLPELAIQYGDYAVWQRSWLQGEALEEELGYWRRRLAGAPAVLDLPADRPRPAIPTGRGAHASRDLPQSVGRGLHAVARAQAATPFMVLLAAFQALLARMTGETDLSVGTPIAGRDRLELEPLIGFFVNTLVLRGDLAGDPGFAELVRRSREATLEAHAHQALPFERLVEELQPQRSLSHTPLFQVVLALQNAPAESLELPGLTLGGLGTAGGSAKFDLTLVVVEHSGSFGLDLEYRTDLFDGATAERLLAHFETLLAGALEKRDRPLSELPLLDAAERRQLLEEWNDTSRPYPRERTIPELFAELAARWPERVAVELGAERLTYAELSHQAAALASRLRRLGVGPDELVGLYGVRSPEMIAGVLGILAAGGAYLPLDPGYPVERLAWMLADAGARRVVGSLPEDLAGPGIEVIPFDDSDGDEAALFSPALADPGNLAYVMYTSGSTGRPKGVAVTHRNVVRLVRNSEFASFGPEEVFLHLAPLAFDASTLELWGPLLNGGRLVLMPPGVPSLASLGEVLREHGVTSLWLTAGLFHQMVEEQLPDLAGLRQLLAGGDVLSPAHVQRVLAELPGCALINGYGPTENTTFTCCHRIEPGFAGSVPIGRPITNTRVFVVDRWGSPAPLGVPGELLAGGEGLSRGYLNRPELTAERFVPDPWSGESGGRLYRTGDLARWRMGGVLEFLGRLDGQVKVRGYRVELGEVEAALVRQDGVREAVVVVRGEGAEGKRLVGYVVGEPGMDVEALRESLRGALPEPLVPSALVVLESLPLTPNGKVDRQALPAPESLRPETAEARARTPVEELLAGIWTEVLGLQRVELDDDFFTLGGHSLLATQVISRARRVFGVEIALRDLFEEPTVAGLAQSIEHALRADGTLTAPPLVRTPRSARLPLSFAQQRLWFLEQLEPGSAYNIPLSLRLEGALDIPALAGALTAIVHRHEVLRTTFKAEDGEPVQVVHEPAGHPLPVVDLRGLDAAPRETELAALARAEAVRPFALDRGPLLRSLLVRLSEQDHALLAGMHHIVSDGWSVTVLIRELGTLYAALAAGRPAILPELPVQYADFAAWQRGWLQGEALEAELGYWRGRLAGAPAALELPTDRPRPAVLSQQGSSFETELPAQLAQSIAALGRAESATPFMVLLAAFQALLARFTGDEDLSVGTPIAGRNREEIEPLIGFFVNTLVLRTDLSGDPSFRDLVGRVREVTLGAHAHQDVPFERLVEELQPERSLAHAPLFQVMFDVAHAAPVSLRLPALRVHALASPAESAKYDLTLSLVQADDGLSASLSYSTDLFESTTAERWLGHFQRLLTEALADPGAHLSDLPLLSPGERAQVLAEWGIGRPATVSGRAVHELFAAQAARTPEAIAVRFEETTLTYGELHRRANRLAHRLRALGAGPETLVGLCVERSPEMLVGLLGILESGAAYVPLDPALPPGRLALLLDDLNGLNDVGRGASAPLLVTSAALLPRLPGHGIRPVLLDDESALTGGREDDPGLQAPLDRAAYVIYTSGSTGRPKGVVVSHRSLAAYVESATRELALSPADRVLQFASLSFDASAEEIYPCLASGGTLVLRNDAMLGSIPEFLETCGRWGISVLDLPTAFWHEVVSGLKAGSAHLPASVRLVILGGEAALADKVAAWRRATGEVRLLNTYGPTEATIVASAADLADLPADRPVPIGGPVPGSRAYVLDRRMHPLPAGVPGELCLGGGLARGYLHRPDLTAERFVPDPWSEEPGERLYRSGDLARWGPAGELDFLGRLDQQVKVRGFRIEPGEIEAVLAAHPGVTQAAVTIEAEASGAGRRLVAYVVPGPAQTLAPADLRSFLQAELPAYMVPAAFVLLDDLPRTPTGKIDRRALPALRALQSESPGDRDDGFVAPRTPTEEMLAGILAEVLGQPRVGARDNFFDLGGHSLLATQVISRARRALGVEVPLKALFEAPTAAGLAEAVEGARTSGLAPVLPPPTATGRHGDLPLSFAQERLWFLDQLEPGSPLYNMPVALVLDGDLDVAALAAALAEVVRRHEVLRTSFTARNGRPIQVVTAPAPLSLPLVDLSALEPDRRKAAARELIRDEARRPFDLARGPLLRALLVRLGECEHALLAGMHHIASDGWSMTIFERELAALYRAAIAGASSPLPELPLQYADFAAWQRGWLQGEVLAAELDVWRRRLAGAAVLELPTDRPRLAVPSRRGAQRPLELPPGLARGLQALARQRETTLFMVLLAGFQAVLSRHSGQDDISVGTPVAGRNRLEIEPLIGFFVNTLVLRTDLSGDPGFGELLRRIREGTLEAHAHQDLPFERLVEELHPERSLSHTPLFQVLLDLAHAGTTTTAAPGLSELRVRGLESGTGTAKFDLSLHLIRGGEEIGGALVYSTDLFDDATAGRLLDHLQVLLAGAVAEPERPVHELPLLTPAERNQLLEGKAVRAVAPEERPLHEIFTERARRSPMATALVFEEERLSYAELDRRADRLAHRLRRLGVGPESRVGLCLERSPELVVALLAILKAGGAYVPLDPAHPRERVAWTLADSGAAVLVSRSELIADLPDHPARVLLLDAPETADADEKDAEAGTEATANNAAYVIYTSGSTGRPKGVVVTHRQVTRLFAATAPDFGFDESDAWTLFHSAAFDFSVWEIWGALLYGGRLVIVPYLISRAPEAFRQLLVRERVTVLNQTPSAFHALMRADEAALAGELSLRQVIFGGEALDLHSLRSWFDRHGDERPRLVNMYGITETTVHVTFRPLTAADAARGGSAIGGPIPDLRAVLLDRRGGLVPAGVPGELHVAGAGLARGYHERPALTAERFVPDAWSGLPGERLYRSGDLARRLPNGDLEYLGRIDHQVKVRGFRIELGEIEAALGRCPGVREAVVLAADDPQGGKRLVAYLVGEPGHPPAVGEVRERLRQALPEYMVPAGWVTLEKLPLTANGKVDRRVLAGVESLLDRPAAGEEAADRPRTPVEEVLAAIWSEVLRVDRVGLHDGFFDLGGHSLLATQLIARVRQALGCEIALRTLFERPTVAGLAAAVAEAQGGRTLPPLVPVAGTGGERPLSFAQRRLWFIAELEPQSAAYNIPAALALSGTLNAAALAESLTEIVRRHEVLRTRFEGAGSGTEPMSRVSPAEPLQLPLVDLSALPEDVREEELDRRIAEEAGRPFDFSQAPMLRAALLRRGPGEHALLVTVHHIASDGWSRGILVRELAALYTALAAGRPSPLPELAIQYGDYAAWQRSWLQGETLEEELAYWRRRLAGAPAVLDLPADRPRPAIPTGRGAHASRDLPQPVGQRLHAVARAQAATPFMVLLVAFQALLARMTGETDLSVGTPIAGRDRLELEPLIGFFVNTLVLRADLAGDPSFAELVRRSREATLEAHAHQALPFERLVEELQPQRSLSHTPLFQVVLTLQNASTERLELPGLTLGGLGTAGGSAKFDLTLVVAERSGSFGLELEYRTDLFDGATAERLLAHFETLLAGALEGALEKRDRPLSELPLLNAAERRQLLEEWNDTSRPYPRERTIPELFADQAVRWPERVAVELNGERLTYAELSRRAAALASRLRRRGVSPDEIVGLYGARSPEMIVGVLGILAAGAAYLPLDPGYPVERLAWMLADAGVRRVVGSLPEDLAGPGIEVIPFASGNETAIFSPAPADPDNLAYVMYTSGSTGRPKGVAVTHRNVVRLVRNSEFATFGPEEVFLHLAPLAFDASTLELWGPLLNGGRLVLMPPGVPSLASLGEVLREHRVTSLWLTAGLFHQMVEEQLADLAGLRQLLAGGDVLSPAHVQRAMSELPGCALINGYGPTENTTFTCCHRVEPGFAGSVPIGRPITNTRVFVVDRWGSPAPLGVPGELLAGGEGLSRGYLNRPELTAERFVPDPWSGEPGGRLYRTGDLVRWRTGGVLEFLGRLDGQVKVRGYRVELGEVEAALVRQAGVREAVAVVRGEGAEGKRLVGYVVGEPGMDMEALRESLRGELPEPLVPSALVVLESLPLTPNGKVDRQALPAPESLRPETSEEKVRTPVEELLAGIWAEVLGFDRVEVDDDFFTLGGHSLLATQVISRARRVFGVEIALRDLFEEPTVSGLAQSIERALRAAGTLTAPPLVRTPRGALLPLSFAQQRLWFLEQLEPGSTYNIPLSLRLEGSLNIPALAGALTAIVHRHEVLRTTFKAEDDEPVQVVHEPAVHPLPVVDLRGLAPAPREMELAALARAEAVRPFALDRGPLLRSLLVHLGAEEHALLAGMHHIVSDGWSVTVLVRELGTFYAALAAGRPAALPVLPVQYADFAAWQRGWLQGEALEVELGYWRDRLAGAPPALELPADRPRPAVLSQRGASLAMELPAQLAQSIAALSRAESATPFMVLLAAFQALLARHTREDDLSVGTPIAGRNREEIEPLIGFFVNTLVLRTDLSGDPSFRDLVGRVREVTLGAHAHQDVPFERLVEELQPERSLAHTPLFQVMFTFRSASRERLALPGLGLRALGVEGGTAKVDLTLGMELSERGLGASLEYATDLFDATTARRLLEHLGRLLAGAVAEPRTRLAELPLLGEAELAQVVTEWNDTRAADDWQGSIPDLFEAQAERTPDRMALAFEGRRLTYAELDRRANRLAHRLRDLGVGPESLIGVFLERSVEMVVGLLGILKAGGAYVPLDPEYPLERLEHMVADSGASVLLTQEPLRDRLQGFPGVWICLDEEGPVDERNAAPPPRALTDESLAYMIYTSGSTGRPKGAMNTHGALRNRLRWMQEAYGLTATDRVLQKTPFSFDVSVWEFFWPLLTGAALVVARPGGHRVPSYLRQVIVAEEITTLHFVPSMLGVFLEDEGLEDCRSLVRVICSGEALPPEMVERFFARLGAELHNLYGPTEAAIDVTAWPCVPEAGRSTVPIGRPIANLQIHILEPGLSPAGIGLPGELHIGGAGLARGYHGRPELTAERFVPDPFGAEPGARLYRTGDLARWARSGEIEYLGRLDFQVKLRGFRIELGEIEAVLSRHPGAREAVVVLRPSEQRLVAYVVPAEQVTANELRGFLRERLPDHMVPAAFVLLEALPLSPNGKIDRRLLPAPEARADGDEPYLAPRTPVEEVLAAVWSEVLGIDRIGVRDSFFDLGGHSLLATRVISRVRTTLGVELPLRTLFEAPTVARLAAAVEDRMRQGGAAPPLVPAGRDRVIPLSFAQQRLWFLHQIEDVGAAYTIPVALRLGGPLDAVALAGAFREVVRRHESLRTRFVTVEGEPRQVIDPAGPAPLPRLDLAGLPPEHREAEIRHRVREEMERPFDLSAGPLFETLLLRLGEDDHLLLARLHHILGDAWSLDILGREVGALYEAFAAGRPSPLPELRVQSADFAIWQREWLRGEVLEAELQVWRRRLAGLPPVLDLPTDRPRPAVQTFRGASRGLELSDALAGRLRDLSRQRGATLFMTLLAGFQGLLARFTGQEDVSVGAPVAGRTRVETEGLIGFFVNTLVLRGDLSGDPDFLELLGRVRETALEAYSHQELPFEKLVEEIRPERSLSHSPLFQVVFQLTHAAPAPPLRLPGLTVAPLADETTTAKFDLTLTVAESAGRLNAALEYNVDLFDSPTIVRLLERFQRLLDAAAADPRQRLSDLPLLEEAERAQLLQEWNDTAFSGGEAGTAGSVLDLFEARTTEHPDALAVALGAERLTYAELDARANRLARRLRALGLGPEGVVVLCADRSPGLVVGMLAVLKAGGAYLPLDPATPPERLAWMIEDAWQGTAAPVLLTQERIAATLPPHRGTEIWLDAETGGSEGDAGRPERRIAPQSLAYFIYTSGSTGQPKRVMLTHQGLLNLVLWHLDAYQVAPGDRASQLASIAFDASVWEIWPVLAAGASLHLPADAETRVSAPHLLRWLEAEEISLAFLATPLAESLLENRPERLALRALLTGGDQLHAPGSQPLPCRLVNHYGPTESTVVATAAPVATGGETAPPIGRPIANLRTCLLDRHLHPVPIGVAGELWVGGTGLARGYDGRPDLTAERFLPDPFGPEPGARLYRTGDLARQRTDGSLDFLRRIDNQVKVRGFRIELGEIEAVLARHPAVRQTAVLARDTPSGKRLAAWLVLDPGSPAGVAEIREHLQQALPDYMVPSTLVALDALPLTVNGKVDRRALLALQPEEGERAAHVPARDTLELVLTRIWEDLLETRPIGVRDDFFERGGHSLLAVRLAARIHSELGRDLPLATLLEGATIERLAMVLRRDTPSTAASPLIEIQSGGSGAPLFCAHPVGGSVFCYLDLARRLSEQDHSGPVYGFQAPGLEPGEEALVEIEQLAARYCEILRDVYPAGPCRLSGWSMGALVAWEMARQLRARGREVALLALIDPTIPGDRLLPADDLSLIAALGRDLIGLSGRDLHLAAGGLAGDLAGASTEDLLDRLSEQARQSGALPPEIDAAQVRRLFSVFKANSLAAGSYRPGALDGPLALFLPEGSRGTETERVWTALAGEGTRTVEVPGDHFSMLRPPQVSVLADRLIQLLESSK